MAAIVFNNADIHIRLQKKRKLKHFISLLFLKEHFNLELLSYTFCSDIFLLQMNRKFLHHDYLTDIITFDLSENKYISGDIYISIERVKDNANTHQTSFNYELLRVIFHGALHLCGYNDKSKKEKSLMTKKENEYLELYKTFHVER